MIRKIYHALIDSLSKHEPAGTHPVTPAPKNPGKDVKHKVLNKLLRSIMEDLDDGCIVVRHSLVVQFANRKVSEWFGRSVDPVGKNVMEVLPDHRLIEVVKLALRSGERVERRIHVPVQINNKTTERYFNVSASPVELGAFPEDPDFIQLIIRDDTQHHETEQIRKDFVANASHELRTPLSIINGYLENLTEGVIQDEVTMQRALKTMQKHGERIARIVEDMLTISKFESVGESDTPELRRKTFDLCACVRDVVERLKPMIEGKKARINVSIDKEGEDLAGDRFYWDQVFFNLIENALKENDREGLEVTVSIARADGGHVLQVRDNGVGIPRNHLPFVFKRFYRVAKHRGSEVKGTGLGLSIVTRAVEAHGGKITVESTPGVETIFTIKLPPPPGYKEELPEEEIGSVSEIL